MGLPSAHLNHGPLSDKSEIMMKITTVANQKGGVGKTTLEVHLASYAAEDGKRVLSLTSTRAIFRSFLPLPRMAMIRPI